MSRDAIKTGRENVQQALYLARPDKGYARDGKGRREAAQDECRGGKVAR
jgi:hypothetical protein